MGRHRLVLLLCAYLFAPMLASQPLLPTQVPRPLEPWVGWVLQDHQERLCPFLYNSAEQHRCAWPSRLALDLSTTQGRFAYTWLVYAESWVRLPGDMGLWPQEVRVDGSSALVVEREGKSALRLGPGKHEVLGQLFWDRLPETLSVPPDTGLIALTINGKGVPHPEIEATGQLWLKERDTGRRGREDSADRLELEVFRRVIDEVPLEVLTRIALDVAGDQRELLLGTVLLPGFIPLRLESPLPARLEPDGRLRLQLRPGHWIIELAARAKTDLSQLPLTASQPPWAETEV